MNPWHKFWLASVGLGVLVSVCVCILALSGQWLVEGWLEEP